MRVTTAFNRILQLPGASVAGVRLEPAGIVVEVRLRARRPICPCGAQASGRYDTHRRRWRHLDMAGMRVFIEASVRRILCRSCHRVRTEAVPFAPAGARHTAALHELVLWLAQRMDKTAVARLCRIAWSTVDAIVQRAVEAKLEPDRLKGLTLIGVDEHGFRRPRRFLTLVVDHQRPRVVWVAEGKRAGALEGFYRYLGQRGCSELQAVSLDLAASWQAATDRYAPTAAQCADPFHVIKLANNTLDDTRRWAARSGRIKRDPVLRWVLLRGGDTLDGDARAVIDALAGSDPALFRAWRFKEDLRALYRLGDPSLAARWLDRWLARACRCRIPPVVHLSRVVRANRDRVLGAIELGLSNSRLEGINNKVRLINRRGYGHHSAGALAAMIYLCCGGLDVRLPHW